MNIIEIEKERGKLKKLLAVSSSPREKVLLISEYFNLLLKSEDKNLIESFVIEFIDSFIITLTLYSPIGIKPSITENLIKTTDVLVKLDFLKDYREKITRALDENKLIHNVLLSSLRGEINKTPGAGKHYIPVLEETSISSNIKTGLLETISVHLRRTKDTGKFIIVPSGKELEKRLIDQVKISWKAAIEKSKKYLRKNIDRLEVVISFDKRLGYYTGDSLGTALAILFLEEILKYYNSPVIINKNSVVAITGGMDKDANILSVSEEIVKEKTEVVFYSGTNLFVVPKQDEGAANEKLENLKNQYPNRKLKIVGIEGFDDVLNRRDIVEISKQKSVIRAGKFAKKHWISLTLMVLLASVIYVAKLYDFDNNPAILVNEGYWLYVQNKNGKELWKKRMGFSSYVEYDNQRSLVAQKIIDIDDDGTNEVILARDDPGQYSPLKQPGRVACFTSNGKQIWEYYFRDTIESVEMVHSTEYQSYLIDTITINESKTIACFADNVLYPSAVYFLNLKTGKRIDTTMWHVGHLHSGIFRDLNQDGKMELIMSGLNNSLGRVVIFSIDVDKVGGQLPAVGDRMFEELPFAEVNNYVVLPKSDYTSYFGLKFNQDGWGAVTVYFGKGKSNIYLFEGQYPDYKGIMVDFNKDLTVKKLDVSEGFQVARDALVESEKLQPPYSHSKEYLDILFKQIRFWNGTKFVTEEKLRNKSRPE